MTQPTRPPVTSTRRVPAAATPWPRRRPMPCLHPVRPQNPEDSRFCASCGARAAAGAGRDRRPRDLDDLAVSARGPRAGEAARSRGGSRGADQAALEALPAGLRAAGRAARPERRQPLPARRRRHHRRAATPRATSSSTTSRSPAGTRSSSARATASSCATSAASTAPTSTASASTTPSLAGGDEVQIGKYRLVFFPQPAGRPARAAGR